MKKKIIFVTKALWIGGIETALVNLLNHFDYQKYDVTLLVLHAELNLLEQINPNCRILITDREKTYTFSEKYQFSRLYHLTEEAENPSCLHKMLMWTTPVIKWIENRLYIRYIRRCLNEEHFDTCVIYSDVAAETAIRAVAADRYLMYYHHGAMRHVYHDSIAYRRCEKIIAVSENQANELKRFVPSAADKVMVIHNLTDVEGIRQKAKQSTQEVFDPRRFHIVTVGRVSHEKGMDIAVQVCAKLVESGRKDICWWIVGDGPAMQEVRTLVEDLGVGPYMKLVGMKGNPYPYIRQADLYVQPSRFEGYPMTILEALVIGQPVISTDNNGAREILRDGKTGILCKCDASEITKELQVMLQHFDSFEALKKNVIQLDFIRQNEEYMEKLADIL